MSGRILVTPEEVRAVAAEFKKGSEQSNQMVQSLTGAVGNLHSHWEGVSSTKFYAEFTDWQKQMQAFVVRLDEISTELLRIADRFEQADQAG